MGFTEMGVIEHLRQYIWSILHTLDLSIMEYLLSASIPCLETIKLLTNLITIMQEGEKIEFLQGNSAEYLEYNTVQNKNI